MQTRLEEAHAEALLMVAQLPDAQGEVNGYPVSPADIAAFVVARAVAGRRGAVKAAVWRMYGAALEIAGSVEPLVRNPLPMGNASGRHGVAWTLSGQFLHVAGEMFQMSVAAPGIHANLPKAQVDHHRLRAAYVRALLKAGVRSDLILGVTVSSDHSEHGDWTRFEVPMPDPRLTARGEIHHAAHLAEVKVDESLSAYAGAAVRIQDNHETLTDLMDRVAADAALRTAGVEGMATGAPQLYSISHYRTTNAAERVTAHLPVLTLTEGLAPITQNVVYASELGLRTPTDSGMEEAVEAHRRRSALMRRHGGIRVDATGMAALRHKGHDADAMLAKARTERFRPKQAPGTDHIEVGDGRAQADVALSDRVRLRRDRLEATDELPETVMQALAGRPARSVVDHPALEGATISRVVRSNGRTRIHIEPRWEIVP